MDRKQSGKERGGRGRDRERSLSRGLNSGQLKCNGATCQHAVNKAIGACVILHFKTNNTVLCSQFSPNSVY